MTLRVSALRPRRYSTLAIAFVAAIVLAGAPNAVGAERPAGSLDAVEAMLAQERPEEAIAELDRWLRRRPDDARALLLRSTARFMLGEADAGRADLVRSLDLDPSQREGWLNLAGLEIAAGRWDAALAAFERAERLDPDAPENDLNLGTTLLLRGDLEPATRRFARYLAGPGDTAEGHYLVAKSYATAGYEALAVETLRTAIERDERARRSARTDPAFAQLSDNPRYRQLLAADSWTPPPGTHRAERTFPARYDGGRGTLMRAVLDALQLSGRPLDPWVEVTEEWALVWSDVRIKVSDAEGGGLVELTAPPGRYGGEEWAALTADLFRQIALRVAARPERAPAETPVEAPLPP